LNGHGLNGKSLEIFQKAFKRLCDRYDQRLISNDIRSCYVEFMIATILGEGWRVVSADWAGWDLEDDQGARVEIKQSTAYQPWTERSGAKPAKGSFGIEVPKGYYEGGWRYVELNGRRAADLFIFAWHESDDHRDAAQWIFFVVPEAKLPSRKKIGLSSLRRLADPCSAATLGETVNAALRDLPKLKTHRVETQKTPVAPLRSSRRPWPRA
jgi:hypothetical protein